MTRMPTALRADLIQPSERFHKAVRGLAVSPKPLRQRIGEVFAVHLSELEPDRLPPEIGARLKACGDAWRAQDYSEPWPKHFGLVVAWARNLTWKQARAVAHWVCDADDEISHLWWESV